MTISLSDAFDKTQVAERLRELMLAPIKVEGAAAYDQMRSEIFKTVPQGNVLYEWQMKLRMPSVIIMAPRFGRALCELDRLPVKTTHYDYPGDHFKGARAGKFALALTRHDEPKIFMISKKKVQDLVDPLARQEQRLAETLRVFEASMRERGLELTEDDVRMLFSRLDQQSGP